MARKSTAKSETTKPESVKAQPAKPAASMAGASTAPAKAPRARAVKAKPSTSRNLFSLQLVAGASVLTEAVDGGVVTTPKLKPGCTVEVSYLKDLAQPLSSARLHARLDGVPLASKPLGYTDADGRFVRTPVALALAPEAQKLEYWFELTTVDGQTLWDSNWGRNHWLEVEAPGAAALPRS